MRNKDKTYEEDFFEGIFEHAVGGFTKRDLKLSRDWFYSWMKFIKNNVEWNVSDKSRVLEIGCSIGGFAALLKEEGFNEVYASDISEFAVKRAQKLNKKVSFSSFDVSKGIPLKGQFDYIFAFEVVEHIENPEKAIEVMYKKLRKGGYLVFSTPPPYKRFIETPTHVSVMGERKWLKILKKTGSKNVYFKKVTFIPVLWRYNKYLNFALPFSYDVPLKKLSTTIFYFTEKS